MFSKVPLIAILAILPASLIVVADVMPTVPAPGYAANAGSNCAIGWVGDTSSTTTWKNMSIQLMTGDNYDMIPLTTVAQNQDGTTSGSFVWTCPQVTPNSAIYFYQFTSPVAVNKQWTARFTIASSSGQTTPPPNATQPGTGEAIPWGVGNLNDPSTAVPPPAYLSNGGTAPPPSNSTSGNSASTNPTATNSITTNPTSPTTTEITPSTTASASILPTNTSNSAALYTPFVPGLLLSICAPVFIAFF